MANEPNDELASAQALMEEMAHRASTAWSQTGMTVLTRGMSREEIVAKVLSMSAEARKGAAGDKK